MMGALTGSKATPEAPEEGLRPSGYDPEREERVVAAAICYGDIVAVMPQPSRHHDIIKAWHDATGQSTGGKCEQGFVTSEGRFVDRKVGLRIADRASQIIDKTGDPFRLFSEDMW